MKKKLLTIGMTVLGMTWFTACTTGKMEKDAEKDSLSAMSTITEDTMVNILEDGPISVPVPKGWHGYITNHSIELKKPLAQNKSRSLIFMEVMIYPMTVANYLKQSGLPAENKVGEYTLGENFWEAYDRSQQGYPAIYLTEFASKDSVLCVRTSGLDVTGVGNPEVEYILKGVKIQGK